MLQKEDNMEKMVVNNNKIVRLIAYLKYIVYWIVLSLFINLCFNITGIDFLGINDKANNMELAIALMAISFQVTFLTTTLLGGLSEKTEKLFWEDYPEEYLIRNPKGFQFYSGISYASLIIEALLLFAIPVDYRAQANGFFVSAFVIGSYAIFMLSRRFTDIYFNRKKLLEEKEKEFREQCRCKEKSDDLLYERIVKLYNNTIDASDKRRIQYIQENVYLLYDNAFPGMSVSNADQNDTNTQDDTDTANLIEDYLSRIIDKIKDDADILKQITLFIVDKDKTEDPKRLWFQCQLYDKIESSGNLIEYEADLILSKIYKMILKVYPHMDRYDISKANEIIRVSFKVLEKRIQENKDCDGIYKFLFDCIYNNPLPGFTRELDKQGYECINEVFVENLDENKICTQISEKLRTMIEDCNNDERAKSFGHSLFKIEDDITRRRAFAFLADEYSNCPGELLNIEDKKQTIESEILKSILSNLYAIVMLKDRSNDSDICKNADLYATQYAKEYISLLLKKDQPEIIQKILWILFKNRIDLTDDSDKKIGDSSEVLCLVSVLTSDTNAFFIPSFTIDTEDGDFVIKENNRDILRKEAEKVVSFILEWRDSLCGRKGSDAFKQRFDDCMNDAKVLLSEENINNLYKAFSSNADTARDTLLTLTALLMWHPQLSYYYFKNPFSKLCVNAKRFSYYCKSRNMKDIGIILKHDRRLLLKVLKTTQIRKRIFKTQLNRSDSGRMRLLEENEIRRCVSLRDDEWQSLYCAYDDCNSTRRKEIEEEGKALIDAYNKHPLFMDKERVDKIWRKMQVEEDKYWDDMTSSDEYLEYERDYNEYLHSKYNGKIVYGTWSRLANHSFD